MGCMHAFVVCVLMCKCVHIWICVCVHACIVHTYTYYKVMIRH